MKLSTQTSTALAALGLVGAGGSAHAALVTETYDVLPSFLASVPIAVDSSTAQYSYDSVKTGFLVGHLEFGSTTGGLIASTGVNGVGSVEPGLSYSSQSLDMADSHKGTNSFNGTGYVNLEFTNGKGQTEFGYATFKKSGADLGELETITYATTAPEPSTWAILIAGAGALGLAAHRRRRRAALAAA